MYDQCVYILYFQVADAVHGVLYVLSHPKLTTVVEPSPYQLTVPLVMEQSVPCGIALLLLCGVALLLSCGVAVCRWYCVLLVLCSGGASVCVVNTVSWRSLRVCCWYCLLLVGAYQRRQLSAQLASPS